MLRNLLRRLYRHLKTQLQVVETAKVKDNIEVRIHDVEDLKKQSENWGDLDKQEKLKIANQTDPRETYSTHNTTVDGLNEYIVDNLDPSQSVNESASHLAVGTGTATPSTGNSSLNTEVARFATTDDNDQGKDLYTSTFLDTSEANGNTLEEVGLFTASTGGTMLNHSLITSITKDNTTTVTIDVTLEFRAA